MNLRPSATSVKSENDAPIFDDSSELSIDDDDADNDDDDDVAVVVVVVVVDVDWFDDDDNAMLGATMTAGDECVDINLAGNASFTTIV